MNGYGFEFTVKLKVNAHPKANRLAFNEQTGKWCVCPDGSELTDCNNDLLLSTGRLFRKEHEQCSKERLMETNESRYKRKTKRKRERERNEFSKWNEKLAEITQRFHKYRTKYFGKKRTRKTWKNIKNKDWQRKTIKWENDWINIAKRTERERVLNRQKWLQCKRRIKQNRKMTTIKRC